MANAEEPAVTPAPTPSPPTESAYEVVSASEYWGVVSIALFVASLNTRFLIHLLPSELQGWDQLPPYAVTAVPLVALVGVLSAWVGGRDRSATCRYGFILNLVVMGLSALMVGGFVVWRLTQ